VSGTKRLIKKSAEFAGLASFVWTLIQWSWRLLSDWQQVDQVIADWPGFVRWLGAPQTGPIIVAVSAFVYVVAIFWPSPAVDPLVGKFFHTFHGDGQLQYQGHVIREQGGRYFIQLYSAVTGEPTDQRFLTATELETAHFYDTHDEWISAHGDWMRRFR
jgi:hypothetical protein